MKNLTLVLAVVIGAACFVPAPASAYYYRGRYYRYSYRRNYYRYHYHNHYYRHRLGLSASMGVRSIIAIGNRIIVRTALTIADVAK